MIQIRLCDYNTLGAVLIKVFDSDLTWIEIHLWQNIDSFCCGLHAAYFFVVAVSLFSSSNTLTAPSVAFALAHAAPTVTSVDCLLV